MRSSHYPAGCSVTDVDRAAGPDIDPPDYLQWCDRNPAADEKLRQRFAEEMCVDLLDELMDLPRAQRNEADQAVVRRHEAHQRFVGRWRLFFTEFYREAWRNGGIPQ